MQGIRKILNRPESKWTAGAVGLLAALAVLANASLISCEGGGSGGSGRSSAATRAALTANATKSASPASAAAPPVTDRAALSVGQPELRVRVAAAVEKVSLICVAGLTALTGDANPLLATPTGSTGAGQSIAGQALGNAATVTLQGGTWVMSGASGEAARLPAGPPLIVATAKAGTPIGLNGGSYAGRLRLVARTETSDRAFDVIEFVPVEDYLPGVVGKELPTGWPLETYRVQAVCARTYAIQERQRAISTGAAFDLESSDHDQVYGGMTANGPAAEAVRSTCGEVLFWKDQVLRAYFSSTCGGRTGAAKDTWPTGPGWEFNLAEPIQSHPREFACQNSPLFRWTVTRDRQELVKRIRAFGEKNQVAVRRIKDLTAVEVIGVDADQRPNRYKVIEPGGAWYQLAAEELRVACNFDAPGCPAIERKTRVNSGDFEMKVAGGTVTISGRGFGHGVGMCQFCAKGFAERGENWRTMVARFYPGARVEKVY